MRKLYSSPAAQPLYLGPIQACLGTKCMLALPITGGPPRLRSEILLFPISRFPDVPVFPDLRSSAQICGKLCSFPIFSASPRLRGEILLFRLWRFWPMPRHRAQFQHFQRTFRPIVFPADDQVASLHVMSVLHKVQALKFKLDS